MLFPLAVAVEEDEAKRKQTKHKRVFLWFGDDLAVDDNPHQALTYRIRREICGPPPSRY